jgi:hypothetical protein
MDDRDTVETPPLMAAGEIFLRKATTRMARAMKPLRVRQAIAALRRPRQRWLWWVLAAGVVLAAIALLA